MANKQPAKKTPGKNGAKVVPGTPPNGLELLGLKKPVTMEFPLCVDGALATARDAAVAKRDEVANQVNRAELAARVSESAPGPTAEILDELEELERLALEATEAAEAMTITFVFKATAPMVMTDLQAANLPTKAQQKNYDEEQKTKGEKSAKLQWNQDTFPPLLVQASSADPVLSDDQIAEMWKGPTCEPCEGTGLQDGVECEPCGGTGRRADLGTWSKAELEGLFLAALAVNAKIIV